MSAPIFVVGASRSGKTLLRWLLSEHSQIAVTRRTQMWPRFYGRFGDLRDRENLDRCLRAMFARPQIRALGTDVGRLRRDFAAGPATYARLFALVHEQYAQRCGKPRWGDQTGLVERSVDVVLASYEGARIVHLIRDPRDRLAALDARDGRRRFGLGRSTRDWVVSATIARDHAESEPRAYTVVRYETLVTEPEATLRDVCAFLGERYEPSMLELAGADRYGERDERGDLISTEFVGEHRGRIGHAELAHVQAVAGRLMEHFDYPLEPLRVTARDRLRIAAERLPAGMMGRAGRPRLRLATARAAGPSEVVA